MNRKLRVCVTKSAFHFPALGQPRLKESFAPTLAFSIAGSHGRSRRRSGSRRYRITASVLFRLVSRHLVGRPPAPKDCRCNFHRFAILIARGSAASLLSARLLFRADLALLPLLFHLHFLPNRTFVPVPPQFARIITYSLHPLFYVCSGLLPSGRRLYNAPNFRQAGSARIQ